ncbi:hypothetical protein [Aureibaculum luteum]|uniref:hypothetical protein n=1 Tax=Aureibaculum luteum TaxID=1548456 RepID=UPI000E4CCB65|nr:hypothetical protein [Aureibaculum luteum]
MNYTFIGRYLLFFIILCNSTITLAQPNLDEKNYYNWFDKSIGQENTDLFNGELYTKTYRTENKNHNFFINDDFITGTIAFKNQNFYDISIKYDIYNDEIIAKLKNSSGNYSHVQLNKGFVNAFTIHEKNFYFLNVKNEYFELTGFYEVTKIGSQFVFYTKHYKQKEEYIKGNLIYDNFLKKEKNFLLYNTVYYEVNNKKDLKNTFPSLKKEINLLYKKNKHLKKSSKNTFFKKIIQQIENYIEEE